MVAVGTLWLVQCHDGSDGISSLCSLAAVVGLTSDWSRSALTNVRHFGRLCHETVTQGC